ncbi:MAG TPA: alpha/beta hydrolase [Candidatus Polarisedimenticolia bacterium]|nr:alpha/beta hydrolase [Candidatus Polarisedimenticolia bacterium]
MHAPRIETFMLPGPAGRLECFLKTPSGAPARAAAVVCHPHPLFGGTLHNKVVHAAAEALVGLGLPALRFNFRGAGRSAGTHDAGRGESDDLRAVLDEAARRFPGAPLLIAGYSFGAYVGLGVGCHDPRVAALIGIAAPAGIYDFGFLRECAKPLTLIHGEADPLAPLGLILTLAAALPQGARVVPIAGAAHNFSGHLDALAARVAEAVPESLR